MEERKEAVGGWMSVPAFGDWDRHRGGAIPDYSVDFSRIREHRRRSKSGVSFGGGPDDDLFAPAPASKPKDDLNPAAVAAAAAGSDGDRAPNPNRPILSRAEQPPATLKKKIASYLKCCGPLGAGLR